MLRPASHKGFTLIELAVTTAILGILLTYAVQSYRVWIANARVRTAAETLTEGLSAARNEAIKRNRPVAFRLVTDLSSTCAASSSGTSWVASLNDPANNCDEDISDTVAPFIVAKKSGAEGTGNVTISALSAPVGGVAVAANTVIFNGVGRVVLTGNTPIAQIDIDSSALSAAESRELRIVLTTGGMVKMCDPSITSVTDTRTCL